MGLVVWIGIVFDPWADSLSSRVDDNSKVNELQSSDSDPCLQLPDFPERTWIADRLS